MTISDIKARLITEFARINTSNIPSVDDGGGFFLTTVPAAFVIPYWVSFEKVPGLPCIMVCSGKRKYTPKNVDLKAMEITATFEIHGRVSSYTGMTGGEINAEIACDQLINDCIRVARSLFTSDIAASPRFKIVPGPIETMPLRADENRYGFMFSLNFATFPLDVI